MNLDVRKHSIQIFFVIFAAFIIQLYEPNFLPLPSEILETSIQQIKIETVRQNAIQTAGRVYISSIAALIIGTIIGVANYFNSTVSTITNTIFYPTQFISEAVLAILAIAILGLNPAIIYLITILAIAPDVFIATQIGLKNMDKKILELGKIYGDNQYLNFKHLVIPQVIPYVFTGLIRAHASAWDIVATVEVFLALNGLGYLVQNEFRLLNLPNLFALVMIIIAVGLLSDRVLRIIKTRIDRRYLSDNDTNQKLL
ncbi:MAG: ABC-type nitrate/sulfonate/bicarbonate transport system permease component [Candidatus Nanohaloarchaea archaeon]|jgi:ABC-type nitrate/sulfonate/bicarbonate transport system permease component